MSNNPFEPIELRLTNIENVLINLTKTNDSKYDKISGEIEELPIYVSGAAALLGYKESTIYSLCHKKKIPHFKKGKLLRFYKSQLLAWVNSGKRRTEDELFEASLNLGSKK